MEKKGETLYNVFLNVPGLCALKSSGCRSLEFRGNGPSAVEA